METELLISVLSGAVILCFCLLFSFCITMWNEMSIHDNIRINDEYYVITDKPRLFYITIASISETKTIFLGWLLFKRFYIL